MLLELGKTYVTRNGQKAKVVYIGDDDTSKNVVVKVEGGLKFYWDNGAYGSDHPLDIMPPFKLEQDIFDVYGDRWIVVSLDPPRAVCVNTVIAATNSNALLIASDIKNGYVGRYKIKA